MKIKTTDLRILVILSIFFNCIQISAQETKSKIQYNKHKNEISIDFQNIFRGTLGTSLVYKKRLGEKKFISLNDKRVLRIRVGGSGEILLNDKLDILNDTISPLYLRNFIEEGFQCHLFVGYEWQKQKKRIQYFYGIETGIEYSNYNRLTGWSWSSLSGYTYTFDDKNSISLPVIFLGGVKYFISPEFSISVETNFKVGYKFLKVDKSFHNPQNETVDEINNIKRQHIHFNIDYLSALNFSYYF